MKPIPKSFLEEYLKPFFDFSKTQREKWQARAKADFKKSLPQTFEAFLDGVRVLSGLDEPMAELAEEMGLFMFAIYRAYYGRFSRTEREDLWEEKTRKIIEIMLAEDTKNDVGDDTKKRQVRGYVKQNTLMAFLLAQMSLALRDYPEGESHYSQVFVILAILAAQLNELVGLSKKHEK